MLANTSFSEFDNRVDTIAALSTPYGVSGIAVVRFSGSDCERLAREVFGKETFEARRTYHGFYRLASGEVLDEVIWTFFEKNSSYTGEPMLEISCHGNPLIVRRLLKDAFERGCRQAEPGEFTRRAFLNHKIDLCRAEAVADVIHAQSEKALNLAQKQLSGSFSREIENFIQQLTDQIATVEAYLDFPEEDLPEEDRRRFLEQQSALMHTIERLSRAHEAYVPLKDGIRTVIVGLPNAGKSTLFNKLLGFERAIVSEIPGTTRDFIAESISIEPYALRLVDTAGLRDTENDIERLGIEQTREQLEKADLILWVIDGSQLWNEDLEALKAKMPTEKVLILLNKADCGLHPSVAEKFQVGDVLRVLKAEEDSATVAVEEGTKQADGEFPITPFDSQKGCKNFENSSESALINPATGILNTSDEDRFPSQNDDFSSSSYDALKSVPTDGVGKVPISFEPKQTTVAIPLGCRYSESVTLPTDTSDKDPSNAERDDRSGDRKTLFPSSVLSLSLKNEACLPMLRQRLKVFLDERYEDVSNVGFLVHERHAEALGQARQSLQHASMLLEQRNADDCLAADLKEALRSLEAIVGRVDYDQVLDKVFSKFCIGK